jgi:hypothetical protein
VTTEVRQPLRRLCGRCGAVVEETLQVFFRTSPEEHIICKGCGQDCSVPPSLFYRLKYARKRWRNKQRAHGMFWWINHNPLRDFMLDREKAR